MKNIYKITHDEIPKLLKEIPSPPKKLYIKGTLPDNDMRMLCIVGARKYSNYGQEVCEKLIAGLAGYNICIVSGLAYGIDSIAHISALKNNIKTIAFPGSGLNPHCMYPRKHLELSEKIVDAGGALISEFDLNQGPAEWTFPQRNRLMAGISHATLVIEAKEKSGTLITAKLALDYNRDVGAVPGNILSPLYAGSNDLIHDGAAVIRNSNDILEMLGFSIASSINMQDRLASFDLNELERKIIGIIQLENISKDILISKLGINTRELNIILSSLEMRGVITEKEGWLRISS